MAKITQDQIDSSQLPSVFEYENRSESETLMSVKTGFTLRSPTLMEFGDWRVRASGAVLYVEHVVGTTWTEQARFEL
jgi:hypothetical protein